MVSSWIANAGAPRLTFSSTVAEGGLSQRRLERGHCGRPPRKKQAMPPRISVTFKDCYGLEPLIVTSPFHHLYVSKLPLLLLICLPPLPPPPPPPVPPRHMLLQSLLSPPPTCALPRVPRLPGRLRLPRPRRFLFPSRL